MIKEWHYSTPSEYSYDASKIEVSGGLVKLKKIHEVPTPVGWWHLNEGTGIVTADSSGGGHDGTLTGITNPVWAAGKLGGCLLFDTQGYVSIADSPDLNIVDSISIEAWINASDQSDYNIWVGKGINDSYRISTGSYGEAAISFVYGGSDFLTRNVIVFNTWQHIVVTYDRATTTAILYVDGVAVNTDINFNPTVTGNSSSIGIGTSPDLFEYGNSFRGLVDEVAIYNKALTSDEITTRYNSGNGTGALVRYNGPLPMGWWHFNEGSGETAADSSFYGNTGTLQGNPSIPSMPLWEPGKLNNCLNFNGNSYVSVEHSASMNITDSITIMGWVKIHSDGSHKAIVSKDPFSSYYLGTGDEDEYAISFFYGGLEFKIGAVYSLDTWHHIAVTFDRATTTVVLYVDGATIATSTDFNPTVTGNEGLIGIGIQPYTDWDYVLDGLIDELAIFNQAITVEDVLRNYNAGNGTEVIASVLYIDTKPFVQPSALFHPAGIRSCDHFLETLGAGNQGQVKYTISNDGIYWFYWNGSDWVTSDEDENYNTRAEVEANISTFSVVDDFTFRAYLISDGTEAVELDKNELGYSDTTPLVSVWDELVVDHAVPGSFGVRIDASISSILEIYELYGLDPTKPLVVSKTSRQAGEINQGISTVDETTTVLRLP
jgi:hypothetical protein